MASQVETLPPNESYNFSLYQSELKHKISEESSEIKIENTQIGKIGFSKLDKLSNIHVFFESYDTKAAEIQTIDLDRKSVSSIKFETQMNSVQRQKDLVFAQEHIKSNKKCTSIIFKVTMFQGKEFLESIHHSNSFINMLKMDPEQFQIDLHTRLFGDLPHIELITQFLKSCRSQKQKKSFVCSVTHSFGRDIVIKGQCSKITTIQNIDKSSISDFDLSNTEIGESYINQSIFYSVDISPIDNQFLMNPNLSNRRKELLTQKFRKSTEQEKVFLNSIKQFQSILDSKLEKQLSREYQTCGYRQIIKSKEKKSENNSSL